MDPNMPLCPLEVAVLKHLNNVVVEGATKSSTNTDAFSVKAYQVGPVTRIDVRVTNANKKED
jgi:hypothetical protein